MMELTFLFFSTMRILVFIPQAVFMVLGGNLFGPYKGFLLSLLALWLSQSIIFLIGNILKKFITRSNFYAKHIDLVKLLEKHGYKILILGVLCPITPSDLFTLFAGCLNLSYRKSMGLTLLIDAPMVFLYGFLGINAENTIFFKVIALLTITFISYYAFIIWNRLNKERKPSSSN